MGSRMMRFEQKMGIIFGFHNPIKIRKSKNHKYAIIYAYDSDGEIVFMELWNKAKGYIKSFPV